MFDCWMNYFAGNIRQLFQIAHTVQEVQLCCRNLKYMRHKGFLKIKISVFYEMIHNLAHGSLIK